MNTLQQHLMFGVINHQSPSIKSHLKTSNGLALAFVLCVHMIVLLALIESKVIVTPTVTPLPIVMRMVTLSPSVEVKPAEPKKTIEPPKPEVKPVTQQKPKPKPITETKPEVVQTPVITAQEPTPEPDNAVAATAHTEETAAKEITEAQPNEPQIENSAQSHIAETEAVTPPIFNADYLDNPAPSYPPTSRRLKEQGNVFLRIYVDNKGIPTKLELEKTSGYERLDNAAIKAVKMWKFAPAKRGNESVAAWVIVPIKFNIKS
ncbi:MAG: TonB family protein [Methylophilus sp.]